MRSSARPSLTGAWHHCDRAGLSVDKGSIEAGKGPKPRTQTNPHTLPDFFLQRPHLRHRPFGNLASSRTVTDETPPQTYAPAWWLLYLRRSQGYRDCSSFPASPGRSRPIICLSVPPSTPR